MLGSVKIYDAQRVLKIDSSKETRSTSLIRSVNNDVIEEMLRRFAVIIPIKNEHLKIFEGVLGGIPQDCPVIIVSNSTMEGINRYRLEKELLRHFYNMTQQPSMIIHQKDPGLVEAFRAAGYEYILDGEEVRSGKGEGMIIGILLGELAKAEYIGFIDADNYIPGAANEYIKDFTVGLSFASTPYVMVRLLWKYKPKIVQNNIYFKKWGRVSEVTNVFMNMLIAGITRFETDIIKTGNSGEHAMSIKMAEIMEFAGGYSIEPYELVFILEQFSGFFETEYKEALKQGVEVFQIETLNPHIHEVKGEAHIASMILGSLSVIYHSRLATEALKERIRNELEKYGYYGEPPRPKTLPPVATMDKEKFLQVLQSNAETLEIYGW